MVVAGRGLVLYVNPELQRLRALVDAARTRLAELEAGFTVEKAKVEAMKARLFARLREHFQRRDRLRLVIGYRRKDLESLVRHGEEEAGKIAQEYRQASAQHEQEYAETAAALAEKLECHAGQENMLVAGCESRVERIQQLHTGLAKVRAVSRHEGELMPLRRGGELAVE